MNSEIQYPKYYAFDWDDNLLYMPTKIILLKDWEEVEIGTQEFAEVRWEIWNGVYKLLEGSESFKNFLPSWDEQFEIDAMVAKEWPSWEVFATEVINKAKIFSIITARGHSKKVFGRVISKMIRENHKWIDKNEFKKNMTNYLELEKKHYPERNIIIKDDEEWLIQQYMSVNEFYPVANPEVQEELNQEWWTLNPEEAKIQAYINTCNHFALQAKNIYAPGTEVITIAWMSDDDKKNLELFKKYMINGKVSWSILHYLWDTSEWDVKKISIKK